MNKVDIGSITAEDFKQRTIVYIDSHLLQVRCTTRAKPGDDGCQRNGPKA